MTESEVMELIRKERFERLKPHYQRSHEWFERVFKLMDQYEMTSDELIAKGYIEPQPQIPCH